MLILCVTECPWDSEALGYVLVAPPRYCRSGVKSNFCGNFYSLPCGLRSPIFIGPNERTTSVSFLSGSVSAPPNLDKFVCPDHEIAVRSHLAGSRTRGPLTILILPIVTKVFSLGDFVIC